MKIIIKKGDHYMNDHPSRSSIFLNSSKDKSPFFAFSKAFFAFFAHCVNSFSEDGLLMIFLCFLAFSLLYAVR